MAFNLRSNQLCLPDPLPDKAGWPWTAEMPLPVPETQPDGQPWPRISVVTPSYNQGQFLEQTIRSVLLQGYPNLEYIIIDGGSSDASVEIIKKYSDHLAYWVSEPDRGQSHAINKGFEKSTGKILCWLNSDDYYLPETLKVVAENLADGTGTFALGGHYLLVYTDGRPPVEDQGEYESRRRLLQFWKGYKMRQPSIFWRREVFDIVGFLDEDHYYIMDFDYWARIAEHFDFKNIDRFLSCATFHDKAKTGDNGVRYHQELRKHARRYWGSPLSTNYWHLELSMMRHFVYQPAVWKLKTIVRRSLCYVGMLLKVKNRFD